jgi:DNA-binding FadR family transcriptional regulator
MPLQTIAPQRLYRVIANQLGGLIRQGEFAVGSRLPAERDLSKQLGVSRPSVREALIALEVEGVVEVRTGSGVYVRSKIPAAKARKKSTPKIAEWGPLELMQARELVESEVAALAARHAKRPDIEAMRKALEQMQSDAQAGALPMGGDEAFHNAIAQACGNEVLRDTVQQYWQARHAPLSLRLYDHFENPASWRAAWGEHCAVFDAICSRNAQGARAAMQRHLKKAFQRYSASWRRAQASG